MITLHWLYIIAGLMFAAVAILSGTAPQNPKTYGFYCTIHGGLSSGQRGALIVVPPV